MWQHSATKFGSRPCLGTIQPDQSIAYRSYHEVDECARAVAWAIAEEGLAVGLEGLGAGAVGVCSRNREEWMFVDVGCLWAGGVTVSLYDTLGREGMEYVVKLTELRTVFCSAAAIDLLAPLGLETLVCFDEPS
jgi:long-chain acyl-CoA synthetase